MKACTTCGQEKADIEFCRYSVSRGGGLAQECRHCSSTRSFNWRKANKARAAKGVANWRVANAGRRKAKDALWVGANRVKVRATKAKWKRRHPENGAQYAMARHATKLNATPAWANHMTIGEYYAVAAIKTKATGRPWHVDHMVPLQSPRVCGLHTDYNMQVLSGEDNQRKNNRHWPDMWERESHGN